MCLMLNVTDHRLYYKVKPYHTPGFPFFNPHQHSFKINSTKTQSLLSATLQAVRRDMLNFNILLDVQQLVVLSTAAQTMWPREEAGKKKKKKKGKKIPTLHVTT